MSSTEYSVMENVSLLNLSDHSDGPAKGGGRLLKTIIDVSLPVILVITMIALGAALNVKTLIKQLKHPLDVFIGLVCQCILLPLVTFGIALAMNVSNEVGIGMILIGCCPGGVASNIYSYWLDGDVPLSLSMTALSNLLAVGTMPLNLYLYAGHWTSAELTVPYVNIVISFLMVFVPVIIGMALNWKWPKKAPIIVKIGSICGMVVIVLITVFISVENRRVFLTTWKPFVASVVMPFCAFLVGYMCSCIACLEHRKRKTIAIETGIQNFPLCMTVLSLSFPTKLFIILSVYPLLYGIVSVVDGLAIVVSQKLINIAVEKYKKPGISNEATEMKVLNQDSSEAQDFET